PVTEYEVAFDLLTLLETKVMTGYLAASKNSGLLRCVSRSSTPVVIELTLRVASTLELAGVVSSRMTVPEGCWNMPRTLENTCLQTNSAEEFSGSSSHFEIWGTEGIGRAGTDALSGPLEAAGAVAVSRELQAGTDSSVIKASTDARMEVSQTATEGKED